MDRLERQMGRVPSDADEIPTARGFVLGIAIGGGLGALVGGKRKGKLLYETK